MRIDLASTPDGAALAQLRDSLHGTSSGRRAAVLVGAGFSRNARLSADDALPPPLWSDFAREMSTRLYPGVEPVADDPLRLAQEYEVAFGRAALDDLIRQLVPDETWEPGDPHFRLLALPWTNVLTTNWDTLLERASERVVTRRYAAVRTVADMAAVDAPRLVKLHGSMPSHKPFIFTEEDYRRYPTTHAPFVNLARQVFIENELVLLGFKGSDPNFLQWAGWVRDHLQGNSRRLYLVGMLELPQPKRRLLQSLNIDVVDLAPSVSHLDPAIRHRAATDALLSYLEAGKPRSPSDWPYSGIDREWRSQSSPTVEQANAAIDRLSSNRAAYPGWVLCPFYIRQRLLFDLSDCSDLVSSLYGQLSRDRQACAMAELAWLALLTGARVNNWLFEAMSSAALDAGSSLSFADRAMLGRALADTARHRADDVALEKWCSWLEGFTEEARAWAHFLRALRRRDLLDLEGVNNILDRITGEDPMWMIRRTGLAAELGDHARGRAYLREALIELRKRRLRDGRSIWIASRLAWAEFLASMAAGFNQPPESDPLARVSRHDTPFQWERDLDPWQELEAVRRGLDEAARKHSEAESAPMPRFEAGVFVSAGTNESGRLQSRLHWVEPVRFVLDQLGSVGRFGNTTFFNNEAKRAARLIDSSEVATFDWATSLCRETSRDRLIDNLFSRSAIARMEADRIVDLATRCQRMAIYALDRYDQSAPASEKRFEDTSYWIERLKATFEVLSRLSLRLDHEAAAALHALAISWSRRSALSAWWTHETYERLLSRSWNSVPKGKRAGFGLQHLQLPLECELAGLSAGLMKYWPEPADSSTTYMREGDPGAWARRIAELLELAKMPNPGERGPALLRLLNFHLAGVLTSEESQRLGAAYWAQTDAEGLPADTSLYHSVVFEVPPVTGVRPDVAFAAKYFVAEGIERPDSEWLRATGAGAKFARQLGMTVPSSDTAIAWWDALRVWRPSQAPGDFGARQETNTKNQIPWFLKDAVIPFLSPSTFAEGFVPQFIDVAESVPSVVAATPYVVSRCPAFAAEGLELVRKALWSGERSSAIAGALAVSEWIEVDSTRTFGWETIVEDVVALCSIPRHPAIVLLWQSAARSVPLGLIQGTTQRRLIQALRVMLAQGDYRTWNGLEPVWEQEAPLAFAAAVETAHALRTIGAMDSVVDEWLRRAVVDPMPEVRAAASALL